MASLEELVDGLWPDPARMFAEAAADAAFGSGRGHAVFPAVRMPASSAIRELAHSLRGRYPIGRRP